MGGSDTRGDATGPTLRRPRPSSRPPAPRLPEIAQGQRDELRVRHDVAAQQPARLLRQAERPLEAHPLKQPRRAARHAGDDVDRAADAHRERDAELRSPAPDEVLLARRRHRDEEQVRRRTVREAGVQLRGAAEAVGHSGRERLVRLRRVPSDRLLLDGISKSWPGADRPVLDDVTLAVEPGTVVHLSGPNGAGKTTLLRIAVGLIRPDRGRVRLGGLDVEADRAAFQRQVGFLSAASAGLYARLTVRDHLRLWSRLALLARGEREPACQRVLAALDIGALAGRRVDRLSMGQRQRVRLAGAFLHNPSVVLLDEPINSLDEAGTALLANEVERLRDEGGAGVWCTPSGDASQPLEADAHVVLRDGRLIAS
jgi:ABC-2 type transport system ATP-binding protein